MKLLLITVCVDHCLALQSLVLIMFKETLVSFPSFLKLTFFLQKHLNLSEDFELCLPVRFVGNNLR